MNAPDDVRLADEAQRELARLLSVEPSAGFVASVRTRIQHETPAAGAWRFWALAFASGAGVLAVLLAILPRDAPKLPSIASARADIHLPAVGRERPPGSDVRSVERGRTSDRRSWKPEHTDRPSVQAARTPDGAAAVSEVLIDHAFADAIRRLASSARPLVADEPPPEVPAQSAVVVEPLAIPEIVVPSGEGNNRQ